MAAAAAAARESSPNPPATDVDLEAGLGSGMPAPAPPNGPASPGKGLDNPNLSPVISWPTASGLLAVGHLRPARLVAHVQKRSLALVDLDAPLDRQLHSITLACIATVLNLQVTQAPSTPSPDAPAPTAPAVPAVVVIMYACVHPTAGNGMGCHALRFPDASTAVAFSTQLQNAISAVNVDLRRECLQSSQQRRRPGVPVAAAARHQRNTPSPSQLAVDFQSSRHNSSAGEQCDWERSPSARQLSARRNSAWDCVLQVARDMDIDDLAASTTLSSTAAPSISSSAAAKAPDSDNLTIAPASSDEAECSSGSRSPSPASDVGDMQPPTAACAPTTECLEQPLSASTEAQSPIAPRPQSVRSQLLSVRPAHQPLPPLPRHKPSRRKPSRPSAGMLSAISAYGPGNSISTISNRPSSNTSGRSISSR